MPPVVWVCDCCDESFDSLTGSDIDGETVCAACIQHIFDQALQFERYYPPRWNYILYAKDFRHILSKDFLKAYRKKEIEYNTPPADRIYCTYKTSKADGTGEEICGNFVGRWRSVDDDSGDVHLKHCQKCEKMSCLGCGGCGPFGDRHVCPGRAQMEKMQAEAFGGLVRGKHWQKCPAPGCGCRVELAEACNHIVCQCGTDFCFVCGFEVDMNSPHWWWGGCPQYNQPVYPVAQYEPEDDDDDDEGSEDSDGVSNGEASWDMDSVMGGLWGVKGVEEMSSLCGAALFWVG